MSIKVDNVLFYNSEEEAINKFIAYLARFGGEGKPFKAVLELDDEYFYAMKLATEKGDNVKTSTSFNAEWIRVHPQGGYRFDKSDAATINKEDICAD